MSIHTITDQETALKDMVAKNKWGTFFGVSQHTLDRVWDNLTAPDGNSVVYITMEIGADLDVFNPVQKHLRDLEIVDSTNSIFDHYAKLFLHGKQKIPNYGGGLGILAGDTLKSMADLKIPTVSVSLLYRKGYFSQHVDALLGQISTATDWQPENTPSLYLLKDPDHPELPLEIEISFFDAHDRKTSAYARVWLKMEISKNLDFFTPEILLDYAIPSSPEWIQDAAQHLYDSRSENMKIIQRRLLGAGVVPALRALGITARILHLNEQHGVIAVLDLIVEQLKETLGHAYQAVATDEDILQAAKTVSKRIVYTIHTPVKAGHDRFDQRLYNQFGNDFCQRILRLLALDDEEGHLFNFTAFAMRVNRATNSVSRIHRGVTQKQFPEFASKITAITNGVHHVTWISDAKADFYNSFKEFDQWQENPLIFSNARLLRDDPRFRSYFEQAWQQDNKALITNVNNMLLRHRKMMHETWIDPPNYLSQINEDNFLEPGVFTIGFARRFSTYKRADLIFSDLDTLADIILTLNKPINFIFAGKAHPADEPGKKLIQQVLAIQADLYNKTNGLAKVVFIPGYDMHIAKLMVSGVHAWLNSPKRPLEASGTSGMKAAMNGVPNISTMDGWWVEGYHGGQTGWKFGIETDVSAACLSESTSTLLYKEDAASLNAILPEVLNTFYDSELRHLYLDKCIKNIELNIPIFNTHRMAAEYVDRYDIKLPPPVAKQLKALQQAYVSNET
ncbi:MAG: alpha-glucan family phosphorylase [Desulfurivibrionaceae bacterium]|nr:alpha-glucan family phosphorylase [Desulfurivibrionaceae bacterium]